VGERSADSNAHIRATSSALLVLVRQRMRGRKASHAEMSHAESWCPGKRVRSAPVRSYHPRMAGDRPALLGLLLYILVAATPTVLFWAALRLFPAAVRSWRKRRKRRDLPTGPALESVVANLRRLRREMRRGGQRTQVRRVALQAAYDDTLLECCRLVEVDAPLAGAGPAERPFARLQTEAALECAGIALDPPGGGTAAA
jgi:hypothetical protein